MMAHFLGFEERRNFCFMKFSVKSVFQPLGSDSVILTPKPKGDLICQCQYLAAMYFFGLGALSSLTDTREHENRAKFNKVTCFHAGTGLIRTPDLSHTRLFGRAR